jgi:hypothetical protein
VWPDTPHTPTHTHTFALSVGIERRSFCSNLLETLSCLSAFPFFPQLISKFDIKCVYSKKRLGDSCLELISKDTPEKGIPSLRCGMGRPLQVTLRDVAPHFPTLHLCYLPCTKSFFKKEHQKKLLNTI